MVCRSWDIKSPSLSSGSGQRGDNWVPIRFEISGTRRRDRHSIPKGSHRARARC